MVLISPRIHPSGVRLSRAHLGNWVLAGAFLFLTACAAHADDGVVTREAVIQELQLAHNSPNPFNANTSINYTLLVDGWVRVEIYDLRGRLVTTLIDEHQRAGDNFAIWKTEVAPSGTYFFCLTVDDMRVFGKMSLVK